MENTKTILFIPPVHWNYYPYRDQELPSTLAQRGYRCIYLNPVSYRGSEQVMRFRQVNKRRDYQNLTIIDRNSRCRKSALEFLVEAQKNIRAVKRFKPDAVISTDHLMSVGVCLYCKFKKIKFIFDVTDAWELVDKSAAGWLYKYLLKPLLARFSNTITCTSKRQFDSFNKRRKRNTYLISNGINPQLLKQLEIIEEENESSSEVHFIGSLRDWYAFDLLFDVFREFPGIDLHVYGKGPLYQDLLSRSQSITNIYVHGNIEHSETAALLKRTLFGILPLKINELNHSTCPIKLFEYWGAKKAVITSPVDEVSRLGGASLLYASSEEEYVFCIKRLLNEKELARKLGEEGKRKVDKIHNYIRIADQFEQILKTP